MKEIAAVQARLAADSAVLADASARGDRQIVPAGEGQRIHGIRSWAEQAPHPDNRISLSDKLDMFGRRQLRMTWTIHELEKNSIVRSHALLAQALRRSGIGEVISIVPPVDAQWSGDFVRASHLMGSTRMSSSPQDGVVDANCRVYETENLYIAGGSVVPVSGATMLTFNLLALALRLADFVKREYPGGPVTA
jgi:choline dehydrogenase-like flavoprotein